MNTNYADVRAVQHHLQPDVLYRPAIAARRLDLATARRVFPELNNVVAKLVSLSKRQGCSALAYGCVVNNRQLNGDSRFDARGSTLLLRVPDAFEADLELLAAQEPDLFSLSTVSLMGVLGYCSWSVMKEGTKRQFIVDEEVLRTAVNDCRGAGNNWYGEPPAIVLPVIVLTSYSLVVGGFWADAYWDYLLAGGVMSKHHHLHSEKVLNAASDKAERIGETPWRGGWWSIGERDRVTEVSVYDMRTPPALAAPCKTAAEEVTVF